MLTLKLKTTRIILISNINNLFLISAYASNDFFNNLRGNQLPAALKESHVSVNWYINPFFKTDSYTINCGDNLAIVGQFDQQRLRLVAQTVHEIEGKN